MSKKIEWTLPQQLAIGAEGDVLVSAAAGSGKTAVLVEKVFRTLRKCDIDKMLIVTFTKAAANQMKVKISKKISEALETDPDDAVMRRQQMLFDKAQITTIDSFCSDVVRNNFHLLENEMSMNYSVLEDTHLAVISIEAADDVLEEQFKSGDKLFYKLMDAFTSGKDDNKIYNVLRLLHRYTSACADPEKWYEDVLDMYRAEKLEDTQWGETIMQFMSDKCAFCTELCEKALSAASGDENTLEALNEVLSSDLQFYSDMSDACKNRDWDKIYSLREYTFSDWPRVKKNLDAELKKLSKIYRDYAKEIYFSDVYKLITTDNKGFCEENANNYPVIESLIKLQKAYEKHLLEKKSEIQSYEFSDISALALQILVGNDGTPSDAAKDLAQRYKFIMVDEYQDTNSVQDSIFKAISNNNLFIVGDTKQSIYGFRQAMPEIFIGRREKLSPYKKGDKSGCILLKNNFRSRSQITDFVNFTFRNLMSKQVGGVDYNEDEYLVPGAEHIEDNSSAVELHLLENINSADGENLSAQYYEGCYLAQMIKAQVEGGEMIADGASMRQVRYSDYAILVRKKIHSDQYIKAFKKIGVPLAGGGSELFFDSPEISLIISFLRAIDNPLRDVDLFAVMYSPIFGFSATELSEIRIAAPKVRLYRAVRTAAENGSEKCRDFLERLNTYRTVSVTLEPSRFIRRLYEDTSLPEIMSVSESGVSAKANLMKFTEYAESYEKNGYFGLNGFVRFLEKVKSSNPTMKNAFTFQAENKVAFMTVHASKGLEYPIVILADTNGRATVEKDDLVFSPHLGIGIKSKAGAVKFKAVSYIAVECSRACEDVSESVRTLYVAMTRARERLIICGVVSSRSKTAGENSPRDKKLGELALIYGNEKKLEAYHISEINNYSEWVTVCAMRHPKGALLRRESGCECYTESTEKGQMSVFLPTYTVPEGDNNAAAEMTSSADDELIEKIRSNFGFRYKYDGIEKISSKLTPSELNDTAFDSARFTFKAPEFSLKEKISSAHLGTVTHRFMEKVENFSGFDFDKELSHMMALDFLTPEEAAAVNRSSIEKFFSSELAKRMKDSQRLEREYEISYLENAEFFDKTLPENLRNEKIFVDGLIDACFAEDGSAVIVDYKTDRVKSGDELAHRYSKQLMLYKRAIEQIWACKVKECHLYSFYLNEDIKLDF